MFEVYLNRDSEKALKELDSKLGTRVKQALLTLKVNPLPIKEYDVKKIAGTDNVYRIRISNRRIIYAVYWEEKEINVLKIARRDDKTYRGL